MTLKTGSWWHYVLLYQHLYIYISAGVTYTTLYNLLNYPAGMLNVTNVTQTDVDNFKDYPSNNWSEKFITEVSKWVSDCCLTPNEQFFSYVMPRTSYICQLCHAENKLQFFSYVMPGTSYSYVMPRTSYNFSTMSCREQVTAMSCLEQVTIFQLCHAENKLQLCHA